MKDPVVVHFDKTAQAFDKIYSGRKGFISRYLDRIFRWDMEERLMRTVEVVRNYPGATVLDIGAGSGRFIEPVIKAGASKIIAIEPAPKMIEVMQNLVSSVGISERVEIIQSTFLEVEFKNTFDITLAIGLYDYIKDPTPYLVKVKSITNEVMIASFPIAKTWRSHIRKIRLGLQKCPVYYYTRNQINDLLKNTGYTSWEIDRFGQLLFVTAKTRKK